MTDQEKLNAAEMLLKGDLILLKISIAKSRLNFSMGMIGVIGGFGFTMFIRTLNDEKQFWFHYYCLASGIIALYSLYALLKKKKEGLVMEKMLKESLLDLRNTVDRELFREKFESVKNKVASNERLHS